MTTTDELRGHEFVPPQGLLDQVPALYATESVPLHDKPVWVHWFCGSADWWLIELDPSNGIAFGWVNLGDPAMAELGYFSLDELRNLLVTVAGVPLVVERDLHFTAPQLLRHC